MSTANANAPEERSSAPMTPCSEFIVRRRNPRWPASKSTPPMNSSTTGLIAREPTPPWTLAHTRFGLYPDAGVPWFAAAFGRDEGSSRGPEHRRLAPDVAKGVLSYLAATQATSVDPERDAGARQKSLGHQNRKGEMAQLTRSPPASTRGASIPRPSSFSSPLPSRAHGRCGVPQKRLPSIGSTASATSMVMASSSTPEKGSQACSTEGMEGLPGLRLSP